MKSTIANYKFVLGLLSITILFSCGKNHQIQNKDRKELNTDNAHVETGKKKNENNWTILSDTAVEREKKIPDDDWTGLAYKEIERKTIAIQRHNRIIDYKKTPDNKYILYLRTDDGHGNDFYYLTLSSKGDSLSAVKVRGPKKLFTYEVHDSCLYAVSSDIQTMEGYTSDYIYCFDTSWNHKWTKHIDVPKPPDGAAFLAITENGHIIIISNESDTANLSYRSFDLYGEMISEKPLSQEGQNYPVSINKSSDNNYILSIQEYSSETRTHYLSLIKINQDGKIIWTKKQPNFFPSKTILSKNGDIVVYGYYNSPILSEKEQGDYVKVALFDTVGNVKWVKEIKKYFESNPSCVIETKDGNFMFSSIVEKAFNHEKLAYIFELNKKGELTFEKQFNIHVGTSSRHAPILQSDDQLTLVFQKWIGKHGDPHHDLIQIIKFKEKEK